MTAAEKPPRRNIKPLSEKIDASEPGKPAAGSKTDKREGARLLNELRERTAEVEKLNQQLERRVADQVGEIERMSRLRRFLPPQVAG